MEARSVISGGESGDSGAIAGGDGGHGEMDRGAAADGRAGLRQSPPVLPTED